MRGDPDFEIRCYRASLIGYAIATIIVIAITVMVLS
jgi:hypothetical protein